LRPEYKALAFVLAYRNLQNFRKTRTGKFNARVQTWAFLVCFSRYCRTSI